MELSVIIFAAVFAAVLLVGSWGWRLSFQTADQIEAECARHGMGVTDPWDFQIMLDFFVLMILAGIHILHTPPIF